MRMNSTAENRCPLWLPERLIADDRAMSAFVLIATGSLQSAAAEEGQLRLQPDRISLSQCGNLWWWSDAMGQLRPIPPTRAMSAFLPIANGKPTCRPVA